MHIAEGVLSPAVLAGGAVLAVAGTAIGLKGCSQERLTVVAVLSAVFFLGSLIHVPLGPGNVHLILNGLAGLVLGWAAFPAILVGLVLQAVLFQYGGLTALGVNTFNMAFPAVLSYYLFRGLMRKSRPWRLAGGFLCGAAAVAGAALLTALSLGLSDEGFIVSAKILLLAHIPIMVIEGLVCAALVMFLAKVKPELLLFSAPKQAACPKEAS